MRLRKLAGVFTALLLAVGATAVALPAASATSLDDQAASRLHTLINDYRAAAQLKPLAWNPGIAAVAQDWTLQSAQEASRSGAGSFLHNPDFASRYPAGALSWSENIAWNMSIDQAFAWWTNSEAHRANMLRAADTDLGIGVVLLTEGPSKGNYLATVNFGQYAGNAAPSQPAETPAETPPAETKPVETPPAETKPVETPAETGPAVEPTPEATPDAKPEPEPTVPAAPDTVTPPAATTPAPAPSDEPSAPAGEPDTGNPPAETAPEPSPAPDQPATPGDTPAVPAEDPSAEEQLQPSDPASGSDPSQDPDPSTTGPGSDEADSDDADTEAPAAGLENSATGNPAAGTAAERVDLLTSDAAALTPETRGTFQTRTSGSSLTMSGLTPGHEYQVFLHSTPVKVGVFTVDPNGLLRVDIPAGLEAGDHRVALYEADGTLAGWQAFTVQPEVTVLGLPASAGEEPAVLASTGFGQGMLGAAGAAMIAAGAALLYVRRLGSRREQASA